MGKELERKGSSDPLYRRWIGTYASEEFAFVVRDAIAVVHQVATELGPAGREAAGDSPSADFLTTP